jgi:hypothetical protein
MKTSQKQKRDIYCSANVANIVIIVKLFDEEEADIPE